MYLNRLNENLKKQYGCKVYKLSLSSGCSCPNRDGTLGTRGCIFCDGAGDFAESGDIAEQIKRAKERVAKKVPTNAKYIAYFQPFSNTYGDPERLEKLFREAVEPPEIVASSIATRPDCLGDDIIAMLARLEKIKPVWVELGLQTIHKESAQYIRRGFDLAVYTEALKKLKAIGVTVVAHMILGLPGETREMMLETARFIGHSGADGIKFHLLHVIRGTDLAEDYAAKKFDTLSMSDYESILCDCIESIPRDMIIHRLTGDGDKKTLIAPLWSANKKAVLNSINKALAERNIEQGSRYY